jgi:nucleoside-diphosphate-sugar epimerase
MLGDGYMCCYFMSVPSHPRDQAVQGMFDRIAGRYDLLNRIISFKLDNWWRKQAIDILITGKTPRIVDLGTGTGDMIFSAMKRTKGDVQIVGLDFSLNMLQLARKHNIKQFVFGSSSSVYGINTKVPFAEDDRIHQPISPYAATKAAGELICHTYTHLYGIRCVCLRFFTVYGARQRPDLAIHKFSRLISEGKPIPVFGDGTMRRDYTYIDDIIQGVRAAIDYDGSMYEVFNLGESQTIELSELISLLEKNLDMHAIIDRQPMQPGDVPATFADISKSREMLGYNPTTKIQDGIPKFVEWFRTNSGS